MLNVLLEFDENWFRCADCATSRIPCCRAERDGAYVVREDDEDKPEQGFSCQYKSATGELLHAFFQRTRETDHDNYSMKRSDCIESDGLQLPC